MSCFDVVGQQEGHPLYPVCKKLSVCGGILTGALHVLQF